MTIYHELWLLRHLSWEHNETHAALSQIYSVRGILHHKWIMIKTQYATFRGSGYVSMWRHVHWWYPEKHDIYIVWEWCFRFQGSGCCKEAAVIGSLCWNKLTRIWCTVFQHHEPVRKSKIFWQKWDKILFPCMELFCFYVCSPSPSVYTALIITKVVFETRNVLYSVVLPISAAIGLKSAFAAWSFLSALCTIAT